MKEKIYYNCYSCFEYKGVFSYRENTDEQLVSVLFGQEDKVFCRTNIGYCDSDLQNKIADSLKESGYVEIKEDLFNIRYPLEYGEQYEQDIRDYANDFVDNNVVLKELAQKECDIADNIIDLIQLLLVKGD